MQFKKRPRSFKTSRAISACWRQDSFVLGLEPGLKVVKSKRGKNTTGEQVTHSLTLLHSRLIRVTQLCF